MPKVQVPMPTSVYQELGGLAVSNRIENMFARAQPPGSKSGAILTNTWGLFGTSATIDNPMLGLAYIPANSQIAGVWLSSTGYIVVSTTSNGTSWNNEYSLGPGYSSLDLSSIASGDDIMMFTTDGDAFYIDFSGTTWGTTAEFEAGTTWSDVTYLDGYFLLASGSKFYIATSDGVGGLDFDSTEFALVSGIAGNIVAIQAIGRYVWVFKRSGAEVFFNSGDADFPFERVPNAVHSVNGPAYNSSVTSTNERIYWTDEIGNLYRTNGTDYEQINTVGLPQIVVPTSTPLANVRRLSTLRLDDGYAIAMCLDEKSNTTESMFCYAEWNDTWFVMSASNSGTAQDFRIHAAAHIPSFAAAGDLNEKQNIVSISGYGEPFRMDLDYYKLDSNAGTDLDFVRRIVFGPLHANGDWFFIDSLYVDLNNQSAATVTANLRYSDDGGTTWSSSISTSIGTTSGPNRAYWRRLGRTRQRIFELKITANSQMQVHGAWAEITVGMP